MSITKIETVLSADVATNGTFAVNYPAGVSSASFVGGVNHRAFANQTLYKAPADFTVSFGATSATVTWKNGLTLPASTRVNLEFEGLGASSPSRYRNPAGRELVSFLSTVLVPLGAPAAGAANAISLSQALLAATVTGALLNGTMAGKLDVPRNVVAAWTNAAVLTVRGTDLYGKPMTEVSASGTSFTGKKAFKTITSVTVSADVTGLTVGTGNVLGLPVNLPASGIVLAELQDGAKPTAGTIVKSDGSTPTGTTGDVRGTYAPNATPDGSKAFALVAALPDPSDIGPA